MATTNMRIVIRRDTSTNWTINDDVVLLQGEQGYETDTGKMKVGDGLTSWASLEYFAGGLVEADEETLTINGDGVISFDAAGYIGDLSGTDTVVSVKDYVDAADSALGARIDSVDAASKLEDSVLGGRIDSVDAAYKAADTQIRIDYATADAALEDKIDAMDTAHGAMIAAETAAREAADSVLGDKIDSVEAASESRDSSLGLQVDALDVKIDQEIADRDAADTALGAKIDQEISDRADGDTALAARLDTVDASLVSLEGADTALGARIDTVAAYVDEREVAITAAYEMADTTYAAQREAADVVLQDQLDTISPQLATNTDNIDTIDARVGVYAGTADLSTDLVALEDRVDTVDTELALKAPLNAPTFTGAVTVENATKAGTGRVATVDDVTESLQGTNIDALNDVDTAAPVAGDILMFDANDGLYKQTNIPRTTDPTANVSGVGPLAISQVYYDPNDGLVKVRLT